MQTPQLGRSLAALASLTASILLAGCAAGTISGTEGNDECRRSADCPSGEVCQNVDGTNRCVDNDVPPDFIPSIVCEFDDDCPDGYICGPDGRCTPGDTAPPLPDCVGEGCPCDTSDECTGDLICEDHVCGVDMCIARTPNVAGNWTVASELHVGDSLPGVASGLLTAAHAVFGFITGDVDLGAADFLRDAVVSALRSSLPTWVFDMLEFLSHAREVISEWKLTETMTLTSTGTNMYSGRHNWTSLEMHYGDRMIRTTPDRASEWAFEPSNFTATATCGVLNIPRHDIHVSVDHLLNWVLDAMVTAFSRGHYTRFEAVLPDLTNGFCGLVRDIVTGIAGSPTDAAAYTACSRELTRQVQNLRQKLTETRVGGDIMTLQGSTPIASDRSFTPGVWHGTFLGGDFDGTFVGARR